MYVSPKWSRLLVAAVLAAGATGLGVTSASANEHPANAGECTDIPAPSSVEGYDTNGTPNVGQNYGVALANGSFVGAYGSNYGDFDLAYQKTGGSTITVYFQYIQVFAGGGCTTIESPNFTIAAGQTQFYEFKDLGSWTGYATVGMWVFQQDKWVLTTFNESI